MKTFWTRTGLVIFGVLLALLLAEAGFRTAGGLILLRQNIRNNRSLDADGTYRILCLGESTTQGQWPHLLEEILNERSGGRIRFKVIDKGVPGTTTGVILSRLKTYLDIYDPHMVVAMMGVNDDDWVWRESDPNSAPLLSKLNVFASNTRLHKLGAHILTGIGNRNRTTASSTSVSPAVNDQMKLEPYMALAETHEAAGDHEKAKEIYLSAVNAFPSDSSAHIATAWFYQRNGNYNEAERSFLSAISSDPENRKNHLQLSAFYHTIGEFEKSLSLNLKSREFGPEMKWPSGLISFERSSRDKDDQHEFVLETALEADPYNLFAYKSLVEIYSQNKNLKKLDALFRATMSTNYTPPRLFIDFANIYHINGHPEKSHPLIRRGCAAMGISPRHAENLIYPYFWRSGLVPGRDLIKSYPAMTTISNLQKARDLVCGRGKFFLCMQYPLREVDPFIKSLGKRKGTLFVENNANFREALNNRALADLFKDMFAGDFGHCTEAGNRLIAENLSKTILRDVFLIRPPDTHG